MSAPVNPTPIEEIRKRQQELGSGFPRIAVFLFGCTDPERLRQTLERVPEPATAWIEEAVIMAPRDASIPLDPEELARGRELPVRVHRQPRPQPKSGDDSFGSERKAACEYGVHRGFDYVVFLRGDGTHPPELLPELLQPALCDGESVVIASRQLHGDAAPGRLTKRLANGLQNRILGLRVRDSLSSYRVFRTRFLKCVPYQLDSTDRLFDVEMLIQSRALGITPREVTVSASWHEHDDDRQGLRHALRACSTAIGYRLHQLHVTQNGRYLVDPGVHYTFKHSESGSHMQIVNAIAPSSRVLDLGCSQGLLARPLKNKDVQVVGVDLEAPDDTAEEPEGWARDMDRYYARDLEQPLELPEGRTFDYVVVADVIEHLRNRQPLLRGARRFLKADGHLIISTPNIALWFYRLSLLAGRFEYGPRGVLDRTHVHLYTRASFRREVERAGFRVRRELYTSLPFEVVFQSTGRSRFVRTMTAAYHLLARVWPEMFAYQVILEAEITTLDDEATSA